MKLYTIRIVTNENKIPRPIDLCRLINNDEIPCHLECFDVTKEGHASDGRSRQRIVVGWVESKNGKHQISFSLSYMNDSDY